MVIVRQHLRKTRRGYTKVRSYRRNGEKHFIAPQVTPVGMTLDNKYIYKVKGSKHKYVLTGYNQLKGFKFRRLR